MKKSKYRNNNYNNQGYSLNFKFDSVSPAGKCCGTALDLIKRYNDLAKEAHGNGDYVEAEVFRQYAEHYRKIVTEINERRQRYETKDNNAPTAQGEITVAAEQKNEEETQSAETENSLVETKKKKSFKVIEITEEATSEAKPKKSIRTRAKKEIKEEVVNE